MRCKEDFDAIGSYYDANFDTIVSQIGCQIKDIDEAKDIVQNAFLRIMSMKERLMPKLLPALIHRTIRNMLMDRWRHQHYVREHAEYIRYNDKDECSESVCAVHEIQNVLEKGISRLDENLATVYRLNVYEEKQVAEISDELELKYKTTENRLYFARKQVREYVSRMLA